MPAWTEKLWGGRFMAATDARVEAFTASTAYEARLVPYDIRGSLAHARVLARAGAISRAEARRLAAGLRRVLSEWRTRKWKLDPRLEDVHGNVEARLRRHLGGLAGKLHAGRSRNDQIALDMRLYLRDAVKALARGVGAAQAALLRLAKRGQGAVMPGYTHLQRAQPILFAHWCLAYFEMLWRDGRRLRRVQEELDECPLGAAALAGSTLPLDRAYAARLLGFSHLSENSLDAVSNRDHLVELAAVLSLLMAHLSRLGEDLVIYSSQEFGFLSFSDAFATGSSIMPQKKNPDVAELLRGRAGRVYGVLVHLLTLLKGQPLSYNRDLQEDKEPMFCALDLCGECLGILPGLLGSLHLYPDRMRQACAYGFLEATDAADYLVGKGVPFREAHQSVGAAVCHCQQRNLSLRDLSLEEWRRFHHLADEGLLRALDLDVVVAARRTYGGTAPFQVAAALRRAWRRLGS